MPPIAITEYAVCNALGRTRAEVAQALLDGRSGLQPNHAFSVDFQTYTGAIDGTFPALPSELGQWDSRALRIVYHLLHSMDEAWRAMMERWAPERVAILIGTSTAGVENSERAYQDLADHEQLPPAYDIWKHHAYGASIEMIRAVTGAKGPGWVVSTACTSSAKTFASAARLIDAGIIDAAIVGGVDTLCSLTLQGFHSLSALSTEKTTPFSEDRQGINIGEGGALMLLEREGQAKAHLVGVGESSDAYHIAAPHPEGEGARLAMARALESAAVSADSVDFINAHGTGTRLNDAAEAKAIGEVFHHDLPVVSTKGLTGHTLGGAGVTDIALCLLAMELRLLPASYGATPLDSTLPIRVPTRPERGNYRLALSNSFAFGGNNISVLLQAAEDSHA